MSMNLTSFTPLDHGFAFENLFKTLVVPPIPLPVVTLLGLCGGMTFAALDYFFAGVPIPTHRAADYPTGNPPGTPPPSSRLYKFIFHRHLNSVGLQIDPAGIPLLGLPIMVRVGLGDSSNTTKFLMFGNATPATIKTALPSEIAKVIAGVDANSPLPIGLVATGGVGAAGHSHQVVGVGYDDTTAGSISIFVYDCRYPGQLCTLTVTAATPSCVLACPGRPLETWHAFFVDQYTPASPTYRDLVLALGLDLVSVAIPELRQFAASFTVSSEGDAAAHPGNLSLLVDPDTGVVTTSTPAPDLAPGALALHGGTIQFPPSLAGASVTVRPCYTRPHGTQVVVPEGAPGTTNLVPLTLPM
jgi:hypothetical protein